MRGTENLFFDLMLIRSAEPLTPLTAGVKDRPTNQPTDLLKYSMVHNVSKQYTIDQAKKHGYTVKVSKNK